MLSWASERMKMLYFTFSEPDTFLLIASWTPSFVFSSLNPLAWRSLFLILLRLMKDWICTQHKSLSHSLCCFPFQISWGPLPKYFLFPFLDCKPCSEFYPLLPSLQWCQDWMSSHCLQHQQHMACKKEVLSLTSLGHWCSHWSLCLIPYLLRLSWAEWCACTWISSICVVRQGLISKFLTVNDFILKPDGSQFIGKLCLIRSYQHRI